MLLFKFLAAFGSGLKVSGNSYAFYDDSKVFKYFADFRANFFYEYFVLLAQKGTEKPFLLKQFYDNNWLQFWG